MSADPAEADAVPAGRLRRLPGLLPHRPGDLLHRPGDLPNRLQYYITHRFYKADALARSPGAAASERAREIAKKDGGGGGLFAQAKRELQCRQGVQGAGQGVERPGQGADADAAHPGSTKRTTPPKNRPTPSSSGRQPSIRQGGPPRAARSVAASRRSRHHGMGRDPRHDARRGQGPGPRSARCRCRRCRVRGPRRAQATACSADCAARPGCGPGSARRRPARRSTAVSVGDRSARPQRDRRRGRPPMVPVAGQREHAGRQAARRTDGDRPPARPHRSNDRPRSPAATKGAAVRRVRTIPGPRSIRLRRGRRGSSSTSWSPPSCSPATTELIEDGDDLEIARDTATTSGCWSVRAAPRSQAVQDLARVAVPAPPGRSRHTPAGRHRRLPPAPQGGTRSLRGADGRGGQAVRRRPVLEPMSSADRKIVHDALADDRRDRQSLRGRRPVPACRRDPVLNVGRSGAEAIGDCSTCSGPRSASACSVRGRSKTSSSTAGRSFERWSEIGPSTTRATAVDIGSGGGVPALVVAADRVDLAVTLVDRRRNERRFARTGGGLAGTRGPRDGSLGRRRLPWWRRVSAFDVVTARSFGPPSQTLRVAAKLLRPGGRIVISEPPAGRRWPPEQLAQLGLTHQSHGTVAVFVSDPRGVRLNTDDRAFSTSPSVSA